MIPIVFIIVVVGVVIIVVSTIVIHKLLDDDNAQWQAAACGSGALVPRSRRLFTRLRPLCGEAVNPPQGTPQMAVTPRSGSLIRNYRTGTDACQVPY